jgi:FkbM family methyltransferase
MQLGSTRFWRGFVHAYVRQFPVARGKRRLMEALSSLYAGSEQQTCELPGGAKMLADLGEHVQRWIYFFGVYEEETVSWFRRTIRPGMTFLDIGAHVGQYTLIAASDVGPDGHVHSFEPNAKSFRRLGANIALNGFTQVQAHPIALSDQPGQATLYVPTHDNMGEASLQACAPGMQEATVRCATLDEWARTADLGPRKRIDLMKIDVQGFEGKVIRGATEVLERDRPTIVCEFEERWLNGAGTSSVQLKHDLHALGYRPHRITPEGGLAAVSLDEVHSFANLVLLPTTGKTGHS